MSFAIDVNVLLYASDDASPFHTEAARFLSRCAATNEVCCFGWPTLMAYLRIATHPRVFDRPLSHEEAMRNVDALVRLPQVRVLGELDGFWKVYREVVGMVATRGNLVPGAHLAALLRQHGVHVLYTRDRDFLKFPFLDVRDPLARP